MKIILKLMASYNREVNKQLFNLIETANPTMIKSDTGSYFGTILGLLNHILVSDLAWLAAFRDSNIEIPVLKSTTLDFNHPGWKNNLYENLEDLWKHRQELDLLFVDFVNATPNAVFEGNIKATRSNGETHEFPFGKVLMHLFNHQTHHRGAISQILDENGVENDYSNLMRMFMG